MTTESNTTITEGKCEHINAYYVNVAGGDLYRNGSVEFSGDYFVDDTAEAVKRITLYATQEAASEAAKATMRDMIDDLAYSLKDKNIEELYVYDTGEVWVKVPIVEVQDYSVDGDFEVENIGEDGSFDLLVNALDGVSFNELEVLDALIASKSALEKLDEIVRKAEQIIREDKKKECIVKHLNTDYELRSEAYSSVKKGWTPEGNYDDVPCEYLEVTITFKDEDGDEETDSEVMEISEGWDYTESEDYERLAKILCERNGLFYDESNWKD